MKRKLLITGSTGMLGSALAEVLRPEYALSGTDIIADREAAKKLDGFVPCDITKKEKVKAVFKKTCPDIVIHSAAWTDVDGCERDEEKARLINCQGTANIAEACKESGAVCLYISTDFVFNGQKTAPYTEDDATAPLNVYGRTKLEGERVLQDTLTRYFIVRTSWLFGPHGRNFVDIILDRAEKKEPLRVVMDQLGSPTYTKDLAAAIARLLSLAGGRDDLYGIYHITNRDSCSWFRYAEEILRIAGMNGVAITPLTSAELDRPATRPVMSVLDNAKFGALAGRELRPWQEALRAYLR